MFRNVYHHPMEFIGTPALWAGFAVFIGVMLALDLGVFHRRAHLPSPREALTWSLVWIGLAGAFAAGLWWQFGAVHALEFTTGYVLEKALSVDNLFVILVVLRAFAVPPAQQHRVLFWGVLGAIALRGVFIFAGTALLSHFHWVMYAFGAALVLTAVKLVVAKDEVPHPERNLVVRAFRRVRRVSSQPHGGRFLVREGGALVATPLLLALFTVEVSDVVFAVDSIPAVFAVTLDPFIVATSNIFAVLGLRSLFLLLANAVERFHLLRYGLGAVLAFVGGKMLLAEVVKVPIVLSLGVVATLIAASIAASLLVARRGQAPAEPAKAPVAR